MSDMDAAIKAAGLPDDFKLAISLASLAGFRAAINILSDLMEDRPDSAPIIKRARDVLSKVLDMKLKQAGVTRAALEDFAPPRASAPEEGVG